MGFEADSKILMISMQKGKKSPVHNATPGKRKRANKKLFQKASTMLPSAYRGDVWD